MPYTGFDMTDYMMGLHEQPCSGDCDGCADCAHPDCRHRGKCRVPVCRCTGYERTAPELDFPDDDWRWQEPF